MIPNQVVRVLSYYEDKHEGQGGGLFVGEYYKDTTSLGDDGHRIKAQDGFWVRIRDRSVINLEDFGIMGEDPKNYDKFKQVFSSLALHNARLVSRTNFQLNKPIAIPATVKLNLDCTITGDFTPNEGPVLYYIGNSTQNLEHHESYINRVRHKRGSQAYPTIIISGLKTTSLTIGEAEYVQIYATEQRYNPLSDFYVRFENATSTAYCKFDINTCRLLHLKGDTAKAWINENTFNLLRVKPSYDGNPSGIIIEGEYHHNHNVFYRGTLEGKQVIQVKNGNNNLFTNMRFERAKTSNETLDIQFGPTTFGNRIVASWYMAPYLYRNIPFDYDDAPKVTVTDEGIDNTVTNLQEIYSDDVPYLNLSPSTPFLGLINDSTKTYDASVQRFTNNTAIQGLRNIKHNPVSGTFTILANAKDLYHPSYKTPVVKGSTFVFNSRTFNDLKLFRAEVYCYDNRGKPFDNVTDKLQSYQLRISADGKYYLLGSDQQSFMFCVNSSDVAYVKVVFKTGNGAYGNSFISLYSSFRHPKTFHRDPRFILETHQPVKVSNFYGVNSDTELFNLPDKSYFVRKNLSTSIMEMYYVIGVDEYVVESRADRDLTLRGPDVNGLLKNTSTNNINVYIRFAHGGIFDATHPIIYVKDNKVFTLSTGFAYDLNPGDKCQIITVQKV